MLKGDLWEIFQPESLIKFVMYKKIIVLLFVLNYATINKFKICMA